MIDKYNLQNTLQNTLQNDLQKMEILEGSNFYKILINRIFIVFCNDMLSECLCKKVKEEEEEENYNFYNSINGNLNDDLNNFINEDNEEEVNDSILFEMNKLNNLFNGNLSALIVTGGIVNTSLSTTTTTDNNPLDNTIIDNTQNNSDNDNTKNNNSDNSPLDNNTQKNTQKKEEEENLEENLTFQWNMKDIQKINYEAMIGQGPDFFFPSMDNQLKSISLNYLLQNSLQNYTLQNDLQNDLQNNNEIKKQYFITKHSNLNYIQIIFHLNTHINHHKYFTINSLLQQLKLIFNDCKQLGIKNLTLQLPFHLNIKHSENLYSYGNGDDLIFTIRDILNLYLNCFKHDWNNLFNLFIYCPKNPKHSTGDFHGICKDMIYKEINKNLHLWNVNNDNNGENREEDTLNKYLLESYFKGLNINVNNE